MPRTVTEPDPVTAPQAGWLDRRRAEGPLCLAHRGGAALFPENTLEGFQRVVELGATFIETDLRLSRDGTLVLCHDGEVSRTTNGSGRVADLSLAELRALDAGYRFSKNGRDYPFRGQGVRVMTFDEVETLPKEVAFNVDIKIDAPNICELLCEGIERHQLQDRIVVASESFHRLERFRRLAEERFGTRSVSIAGQSRVRPRVHTSAARREVIGALLRSRFGEQTGSLPVFDALQIPPRAYGLSLVTPSLVRWAHRHGVQVHVWTINDADTMRALLETPGVDGIVSDRPDLFPA